MKKETNRKEQRYDLSEAASKRQGRSETTEADSESDDVNEELHQGTVPSPKGDSSGENRVALLDD